MILQIIIVLALQYVSYAQELSLTLTQQTTNNLAYATIPIGKEKTNWNFYLSLQDDSSIIISTQCKQCTGTKQYDCQPQNSCVTGAEYKQGVASGLTSTIPLQLTQSSLDFSFWYITDTTTPGVPSAGGFLSLGPYEQQTSNSFVQQSFNQKIITQKIAGLFIQNLWIFDIVQDDTSNYTYYPSQINFGSYNKNLLQENSKEIVLQSAETANQSQFSFVLKKFSLYGIDILEQQDVKAYLSTSTGAIYLPKKYFDKFYQTASANNADISLRQSSKNVPVIHASSYDGLQDLLFDIAINKDESQQFKIQPINYAKKNIGYDLLILETDSDYITFGNPIFYQYFVTLNYENNQVGLIERVNKVQKTNDVPISSFSIIIQNLFTIYFLIYILFL